MDEFSDGGSTPPASTKCDWNDKPRKAQRMAKVTVDTFGVDYPEPEQY